MSFMLDRTRECPFRIYNENDEKSIQKYTKRVKRQKMREAKDKSVHNTSKDDNSSMKNTANFEQLDSSPKTD